MKSMMEGLVLAALALVLAIPASAEVKVSFWHIGTADTDKSYYQGVADAYMKAHPNVKVEITILEN